MLTAFLCGAAAMCLIVLAANGRRLWIMRKNRRVLDIRDTVLSEDATVIEDADGSISWYHNDKAIPTFGRGGR